jgi:hypothetical protein
MAIKVDNFYKRRLLVEALLRYSVEIADKPHGDALHRDLLDLAWEIDERLALVVEAELTQERAEQPQH